MCPCGELCQNRKFQRHQNACVYPVQFGDKGFGLVAGKFIPKESFIIQYIGEVMSTNSEEGKRRLQLYSKSTCTYMMRLSSKEVIDPTFRGNMARFINHSCDPNCETRKWNVRGEIEVGIVAIKDIQEGEELSFDYKFDVYLTPFTACLCGSAKCKGYLGLVPVEFTTEEWEEKIDNLPCEICGSTSESDINQLLLCDICNNGYHTLCCDPPLTVIPKGAWFCTKCSKRNKTGEEDQVQEKSVDEKTEPAKEVSTDKPLKQMLREDKRMRNHYLRLKKKGLILGSEDRNRENDPEEDFLKEYNEFYFFKKSIQFECIMEFILELKQEKREQERALNRDRLNSERGNTEMKSEVYDKTEEQLALEDDIEDEDSDDELDLIQSLKSLPARSSESKSVNEKIKSDISEQFLLNFKKSEIFEKMKQKSFLLEINKPEEVSRYIMPVSTIELSLFKHTESLFRLITQNLSAKLFWNNSQPYHPDIFAKTIEFTVTGTKPQVNLIKDLFKLMDEEIQWYKRVSGFTKALLPVPAIYLKRLLGEFQRNMYHSITQSLCGERVPGENPIR